MKRILVIGLMLIFLPFILIALLYVLETPGILDAEADYPILGKNTGGAF